MSEPVYSSGDAIHVTGATYRQLDYWLHRGYVPPSDATAPGSGYGRKLTAEQVLYVLVLRRLSDVGVPAHRVGGNGLTALVAGQTLTLGGVTIHYPRAELLNTIRLTGPEVTS